MDKKVVIVTGGGSGIGKAIATYFANHGYNVVITGRHSDNLNEAKKDINKDNDAAILPIVADGTVYEEVKHVVSMATNLFGRIDVLINNAQASASGKTLIEHTNEDFTLAVESGLYATFYYMKECFPYLQKSEGTVINFASGAGFSGKPGQSSYAASKEGIRGLTRVAATEWGQYNINVNAVAPLVETEKLREWRQAYPEVYKETIKNIPMGRFGDAYNNVASTCFFLASQEGKYISGETIAIQGGSGLRP